MLVFCGVAAYTVQRAGALCSAPRLQWSHAMLQGQAELGSTLNSLCVFQSLCFQTPLFTRVRFFSAPMVTLHHS